MLKRIKPHFEEFEVGQQVLLDTRNLKVIYPSRKLKPKREGPYRITKKLGPLTYQLNIPKTFRGIHNVFHAVLLSPYHETEEYGPNFKRPPPDIIEGEPEYEVESIINDRWIKIGRGHNQRRERQYLVKWQGYPESNASWESATSLKNALLILKAYHHHH